MRVNYFFVTGILSIIAITGCEKAFMEEDPRPSPKSVFNTLWTDVDQKYAFFEFKDVNWDSVRRVYEPRIEPDMSQRELFDTLANMLNLLKDGHVNLISDFDRSRYWDWYLDYPQNFDFSLIQRQYLKDDYRISDKFTIYYKEFDTLGAKIGYMYVPSFAGGDLSVLDEVLKTLYNCDGIIMDVRDNGGGLEGLAELMAGRFADKKRKYALTQLKDGPAHDDFTKLRPQYVQPEGREQFTRPIALLVNRSSFSATNDFALAMKSLPHATLIGDTTGGGGGRPYRNELPNGWTYRVSKSRTFSSDMNNVEAGVPPDIDIDMNEDEEPHNRDAILERAFLFISNQ